MSEHKGPRSAEKEDLFRLKFLQGAKFSPDGKTIAYVVSKTDSAKDEETSAVYLVPVEGGESRQLTAGLARDGNPQWSPDGKTIAFTSTRASVPQVYLIAVDGGEARPLTFAKLGVGGGPLWSPDGKWVAYTASTATEPPNPAKPYRLTRHVYRFDAIGYIHNAIQEVFITPVAGGEPKQLTTGDFAKTLSAWSPDGREILFAGQMYPDTHDISGRLLTVDMNGSIREVVKDAGMLASGSWTPDSQRIVYEAAAKGTVIGTKSDVWVVSREGGTPENRTKGLKVGVGGGLQPDMPIMGLAMVGPLTTPDGKAAIFRVQGGGTIHAYRIALDDPETCTPITSGERACMPLDVNDRHILYGVTDFDLPCDLFVANLDGLGERRLTNLNTDVLAGLKLPTVERLLFPSADGVQAEGWFLKPPEGRAPYPTILVIHGGPHGAFGHSFHFDSQMLCGAGYGVLMVNHRASTGYGDEFSTAIKADWGNLDYKDLMAGVDYAIAKGLADPDRLGVNGISGGGNLSCWVVGQTDRFKAAVPENPVTNWVSMFGVSDLGVWFAIEELGGKPHEVPEVYARCSPITYAHRCKTPTLLIQGEMDFRCPAEQSEQFYAVLKANGCIVEMLRLPNSPHGGSIAGPLPLRKAQNDALLEWMNRYVLGK